MKVKVYIMHSEKVNYKETIYKPLLKRKLMDKVNLILPLSEKYKSDYIKDLLADSDIVICDLTNFNFFANYELKMAQKLDKDIRYFIKKVDKNVKKYKNMDVYTYDNSEEFVSKVDEIINSLNQKEILLRRENIYCLGKLQK